MKQLSLFEMYALPGGPIEGAIYSNKTDRMGPVLCFNEIKENQYIWLNKSTSQEDIYQCAYVHSIETMPSGGRAIRFSIGGDETYILTESTFSRVPKRGYGWARKMLINKT